MDDLSNGPGSGPRRRVSLRGRGREIMLGQVSELPLEADDVQAAVQALPANIDASALVLTPQETALLLDFSPDSPAYRLGESLPAYSAPPPVVVQDTRREDDAALPDWMVDGSEPETMIEPAADEWAVSTATPEPEWEMGEAAPEQSWRLVDVEPEPSWQYEEAEPAEPEYQPGAEESLPDEPDIWAATDDVAQPMQQAGDLVVTGDAAAGRPLYPVTKQPDGVLLTTLIDDERLKRLSQQIDALHEELIQQVQGDRSATDVYQQELLQASSMLLESRANYDESRAIVYRIRAELNRQRKVRADISRYRPLLLNYYLGWGVAWLVLMALRSMFVGVAEAIGVKLVGAAYYPVMFGVLGALISGYITLDRHTTRLRDFDPIHISWYLFNPLIGGVTGLLTFLLYSIANQDVLRESAATPLELAVVWILCVVAGMNQNTVLRQVNNLLKRLSRDNRSSQSR